MVAVKKLEYKMLEGTYRPPLESVLTPSLSHPNIVSSTHAQA